MTECGKKLNNLAIQLGYTFNNIDLLTLGLTHSSYNKNDNNQRLEFLGDAILNFVIAEYIYQLQPNYSEGYLTRLRSNLVKQQTLAMIAKHYLVQDYMILGLGELKTGGSNKDSILADTLEAIIAAIYLDSNFLTIKNLILNWYQVLNCIPSLKLNAEDLNNFNNSSKDPKSILQELLQAKKLPLPLYKIVKIMGKPHNQMFQVLCDIQGITEKIYGVGTSRQKAEQDAAKQALAKIK